MITPKDINLPNFERAKDLNEVKLMLNNAMDEIKRAHRCIYKDLTGPDRLVVVVNGVPVGITVSGNDLIIQKKVSGVWTDTGWKFTVY